MGKFLRSLYVGRMTEYLLTWVEEEDMFNWAAELSNGFMKACTAVGA